MTNTEKLMICAEAVGIELIPDGNTGTTLIYNDEEGWLRDYNPLTNDAQAFELLRWLTQVKGVTRLEHLNNGLYYIEVGEDAEKFANGETLNEVIVNAVVRLASKNP